MPAWCRAITLNNAELLSIGLVGTNFDDIRFKALNFSRTKMHFKMSSRKLRPFCPDVCVLVSLLWLLSRLQNSAFYKHFDLDHIWKGSTQLNYVDACEIWTRYLILYRKCDNPEERRNIGFDEVRLITPSFGYDDNIDIYVWHFQRQIKFGKWSTLQRDKKVL